MVSLGHSNWEVVFSKQIGLDKLAKSQLSATMTDELRSKSAIDKSSHDKIDDSTLRMRQMQEQLQEILQEMHLSGQDRQDSAILPIS